MDPQEVEKAKARNAEIHGGRNADPGYEDPVESDWRNQTVAHIEELSRIQSESIRRASVNMKEQ